MWYVIGMILSFVMCSLMLRAHVVDGGNKLEWSDITQFVTLVVLWPIGVLVAGYILYKIWEGKDQAY